MSVEKRICNICGEKFTTCYDINRNHNKVKMSQTIEVPRLTSKEKTTWWVRFKVQHNNPDQEICDLCAVLTVKAAAKKLCMQDIHDETT